MEQATALPSESTPAEAKKVSKPRHTLFLKAAGQEDVKIQGKYPLPLKGESFKLKVNGVEVDAAQTVFKGTKYNYFSINGADFWVYGGLNRDTDYAIEFPDGYDFSPAKVDRKIVAAASAASAQKRRDAAKTNGGEAAATNGEDTQPAALAEQPQAAEVPAAAAPKGRKAQR